MPRAGYAGRSPLVAGLSVDPPLPLDSQFARQLRGLSTGVTPTTRLTRRPPSLRVSLSVGLVGLEQCRRHAQSHSLRE